MATPIRGGGLLQGGVKVNGNQAHHYHLNFGMETIQLLMENQGVVMVTHITTNVTNV